MYRVPVTFSCARKSARNFGWGKVREGQELTISISTICPFPLLFLSNRAIRIPTTAIIPPPAKSAAKFRLKSVQVAAVSAVRFTEEISWEIWLVTLSAKHRQYSRESYIINIVSGHFTVGAFENKVKNIPNHGTKEDEIPSRLNPVNLAMINPGLFFMRITGSNPSLSNTPGRKGSMRTSALHSPSKLFPLFRQVEIFDFEHLQLAFVQDFEVEVGLLFGAVRSVLRTWTPSGDLREREIDRLPLSKDILSAKEGKGNSRERPYRDRTSMLNTVPFLSTLTTSAPKSASTTAIFQFCQLLNSIPV